MLRTADIRLRKARGGGGERGETLRASMPEWSFSGLDDSEGRVEGSCGRSRAVHSRESIRTSRPEEMKFVFPDSCRQQGRHSGRELLCTLL